MIFLFFVNICIPLSIMNHTVRLWKT
uniref:Uncharacterized protein n=1 Tax=Rhizophora mucronata TaxID=61149 RepID=A0A2P2J034_RHIMU